MSPPRSRLWFTRFAKSTARLAGRPIAFAAAVATIILWAAMGPAFGFSDTWQLVINTGTTIVTFLMVFLIQNTQNRDSEALQVKLDELIRVIEGAHNALLDLEELEEDELDLVRGRYRRLAETARADLLRGLKDTAAVELGDDDEPERPEVKKSAAEHSEDSQTTRGAKGTAAD